MQEEEEKKAPDIDNQDPSSEAEWNIDDESWEFLDNELLGNMIQINNRNYSRTMFWDFARQKGPPLRGLICPKNNEAYVERFRTQPPREDAEEEQVNFDLE